MNSIVSEIINKLESTAEEHPDGVRRMVDLKDVKQVLQESYLEHLNKQSVDSVNTIIGNAIKELHQTIESLRYEYTNRP